MPPFDKDRYITEWLIERHGHRRRSLIGLGSGARCREWTHRYQTAYPAGRSGGRFHLGGGSLGEHQSEGGEDKAIPTTITRDASSGERLRWPPPSSSRTCGQACACSIVAAVPGRSRSGLAGAVAPGEVVGVDPLANRLDLARSAAAAQGIQNIRFEQGDMHSPPLRRRQPSTPRSCMPSWSTLLTRWPRWPRCAAC